MMRIAVMIVFYLFYWGMCFLATGTDKKNLAGLRSYPEEVQEIVRKRESIAPKKASIPMILLSNLILFSVVFALLWWRNTKRIRFSYLPEKKIYQNPKQHVLSFVRGIPLFAAAASLAALPAGL